MNHTGIPNSANSAWNPTSPLRGFQDTAAENHWDIAMKKERS